MNEAQGLGGSLRSPTIGRTAIMNRKTNRQGKNYPQTLRSSFSSLEDEDDPMSKMIPGTTNRWYDAKHPAQEIDEKKMINSIEVKRCPYCHGGYFRKHGFFDRDNLQDWYNPFSFIWNHHGNMPEMVREILVRLTDTHHLMRYREVMRKKSL